MSTINPITDLVLVQRGTAQHKAPADMSTLQDSDLILVNRGGVDYKCTFLDWKNSQSKAPDVGTVTLSDVAGGARFTSTAFPVSATMVEDGLPKSDKKLKAYVEGELKSAAMTSGITKVEQVAAASSDPNRSNAIALVPLNSLDGTTVNMQDYGAAGFTWTPEGAPAWRPSTANAIPSYNGSAFFNNQPDQCLVTTSPITVGAGDWTFMCWVNIADTTDLQSLLRCANAMGGSTDDTAIVIWSGGKLSLYHLTTAGDGGTGQVPVSIAPGVWTHICVQKTGANIQVYKDGVLSHTEAANGKRIFETGKKTRIGGPGLGYHIPTESMHGYIADFRIYDKATITGNFTPDSSGLGSKVPKLTLTDNTQLVNFKAGEAVTEVKADGTPGDATGTIAKDYVPADGNTLTLSTSTGTWDVGSQVKGPLKTQMETVTPQSDVITDVNTSGAQPVLTFATNKHLAKFAAGDVVKQNDAATGPVYSTAITTPAGNPDAPKAFDGLLTDWLGVNSGGITWRPTQFTSGSYSVRVRINSKREAQVNGGAWIKNNAADWDWVSLGTVSSISSIGIGNTDGIAPAGNCGLAAVEINGSILVDGQITPSGTVASTDPTANTMTLATSTGTWGPANTGKTVIGPTKTGPASNVKLYCKLNATGAVSDLQSADPGFTAWTPTGTGPYTGTVTFPATLPSGQPPDTDLPAGTTLTVEVQASNTSGADSAKSNVLTPAP